MVLEDLPVAGEVVLFEGGGREGRLGVEQAGELRDQGFALHKT